MRTLLILITFIFYSFSSFSQKKGYVITKKDGTTYNVKNYNSKNNYLKLIFNNGNIQKLPYNELEKIVYERKVKRKKIIKITKQFVRISERNGILMNKVVDGKCKVFNYSNVGNNASTFYFVHRENEKFATELGISNYVSFKSYKKSALKYFSDCPKTINKIKKKFNKRKIIELVEFYNNNCL